MNAAGTSSTNPKRACQRRLAAGVRFEVRGREKGGWPLSFGHGGSDDTGKTMPKSIITSSTAKGGGLPGDQRWAYQRRLAVVTGLFVVCLVLRHDSLDGLRRVAWANSFARALPMACTGKLPLAHATHPFTCVAAPASSLHNAVTAATPPERHHAPNDLVTALGKGFEVELGEHFRLLHDTSEQSAQVVVDRLDQTYDAVTQFLKLYELEVKPPTAPLVAVLFVHKADYDRYVRQNCLPFGTAAGFFSSAPNLAVFWDVRDHPDVRLITGRIEQLEAPGTTQRGALLARSDPERTQAAAALRIERDALVQRFNDLVVAHEAAHQVLYNLGYPALSSSGPPWLVEGLACQFEVAQPHLTNGRLAANPMRQADFRTALRIDVGTRQLTAEQHRKALVSGRLVPLSKLISSPDLTSGDDAAFRYAQSWALVFYLHNQHRARFAKLMKSVTSRQPTAAPDMVRRFEEAVGPLDEHWDYACAAYALSQPHSASGH